MITIADFERVDVRVGTILDERPNKKSSNPAYVLTIDFGREIGVKSLHLRFQSFMSQMR